MFVRWWVLIWHLRILFNIRNTTIFSKRICLEKVLWVGNSKHNVGHFSWIAYRFTDSKQRLLNCMLDFNYSLYIEECWAEYCITNVGLLSQNFVPKEIDYSKSLSSNDSNIYENAIDNIRNTDRALDYNFSIKSVTDVKLCWSFRMEWEMASKSVGEQPVIPTRPRPRLLNLLQELRHSRVIGLIIPYLLSDDGLLRARWMHLQNCIWIAHQEILSLADRFLHLCLV